MPRARTGAHRSVAVIALPCPAILCGTGRVMHMHAPRLPPCVSGNPPRLLRPPPSPSPRPSPSPSSSPSPSPSPIPYKATICSSATKEQGHPSTCTSFSCSRQFLESGFRMAPQLATPASSYGPGGWGCSRLSTQEESLSRSHARARMHMHACTHATCMCMCTCLCMLMSCCHRERVPELETPHRPRPGAEARRGA